MLRASCDVSDLETSLAIVRAGVHDTSHVGHAPSRGREIPGQVDEGSRGGCPRVSHRLSPLAGRTFLGANPHAIEPEHPCNL